MAELEREQRVRMDTAVRGLKTVSDKIRALDQAGYSRSEIARFLDKRYQHVRNVLVEAERKAELAQAEGGQPPRQEWAQVGPDGRVVIPAVYRRLLGIEGGGAILMLLEDGEIRLVGRNAAVQRAQNLVSRYVPAGTRLTDELMKDRRAETAREGS